MDLKRIRELSKALTETQEKPENKTMYGTVISADTDGVIVQLDGADVEIPVNSTIEVNENDRVQIQFNDHEAIITGNVSDKSITRTTADGLIDVFAHNGTFSGTLSAPLGNIGGWSLAASAIYRGSSTWKDADGMYFGENGLSIKDKFTVAANGTLTTYSGIFYGNTSNIRLQVTDAINASDSTVYADISDEAPALLRVTNYQNSDLGSKMMRISLTGERIRFYSEYSDKTASIWHNTGRLFLSSPEYVSITSKLNVTGNIITEGILSTNGCTAWDSGNAGGFISSTGRMALVTPSSSGYPNIMFVVNKSTSKYTQLRSTNTNGTYTLTLPNSTGTLATTSSDVRLKENIKDSEVSGLELIEKIKLHEFDWKEEAREGAPHWNIGMIADELEELDENLTFGGGENEDGSMNVKGIETTCLISYLVKAVQELSAEVKALRGEMNV